MLIDLGHPVIGQGKGALALKSAKAKAIFMGITKISFSHPFSHEAQNISISIEPSIKFTAIAEREELFYSRYVDSSLADINNLAMRPKEITISDVDSAVPLAYQINQKSFFGFDFYVDESVLIPKASTETLLKVVVELYPNQKNSLRIFDMGTGCGNILISLLLTFPNSTGTGLDICPDALNVARKNGSFLLPHHKGLFWIEGSFDQLSTNLANFSSPCYDLVISNPPYLNEKKVVKMFGGSLRREPSIAIVLGDGLQAYRMILKGLLSTNCWAPGCYLILEIAHSMSLLVQEIFEGSQWIFLRLVLDTHSLERVLIFQFNPPSILIE